MKALYFDQHGKTDALRTGERPDPAPGPGEVLVRLEAAAMTRLDLFVLHGIPGVPVALPHIPGADGFGSVEALGAGVTGLKPGDRVVLQPGLGCGACEFCLAGELSLCVDFRILGDHRLCVTVSDVQGKGIPAAMLAVSPAKADPAGSGTGLRAPRPSRPRAIGGRYRQARGRSAPA